MMAYLTKDDLGKSLCMVEISQIRKLTEFILLHKIHFDDMHTSFYYSIDMLIEFQSVISPQENCTNMVGLCGCIKLLQRYDTSI